MGHHHCISTVAVFTSIVDLTTVLSYKLKATIITSTTHLSEGGERVTFTIITITCQETLRR